jgi:hypothetical protein
MAMVLGMLHGFSLSKLFMASLLPATTISAIRRLGANLHRFGDVVDFAGDNAGIKIGHARRQCDSEKSQAFRIRIASHRTTRDALTAIKTSKANLGSGPIN